MVIPNIRRVPHNSTHGGQVRGKDFKEVTFEYPSARCCRPTLKRLDVVGLDANEAVSNLAPTKLLEPIDDRSEERAVAS